MPNLLAELPPKIDTAQRIRIDHKLLIPNHLNPSLNPHPHILLTKRRDGLLILRPHRLLNFAAPHKQTTRRSVDDCADGIHKDEG